MAGYIIRLNGKVCDTFVKQSEKEAKQYFRSYVEEEAPTWEGDKYELSKIIDVVLIDMEDN